MKPQTTSSRLIKNITVATLVLAALPAMAATQIVSQLPPSAAVSTVGGGSSYDPIVTPDGRFVLFASTSANLVAGPGGLQMPSVVPARVNVFLRDRQTGVTMLVSVNAAGTAGGNDDSFPSAISTNGQFAVFESAASNLVARDTNGAGDIFVRDTVNNITTLVSVATNGSGGNGASRHATITPDGRYVAFVSASSNLVARDTNGIPDIFVRDLQLGVTALASPGAQKVTGSASTPMTDGSASEWPILSADGRYVVFYSTAIGLVSNVTTSGELYVRDLVQGSTAWVSTNAYRLYASSVPANYAMSANGQWIAYQATTGTAILSPSTGFVFRYNVATKTSDSICTNGWVMESLDTDERNIDISADGRFVAFTMTNASGGASIQLWDAQSGSTTLISGGTWGAHCDFPRLDQTGRYVAFTSDESSLTTNSDGACHIYLRDTSTSDIQLVDQGTNSAAPIAYIMTPFHFSAGGGALAFDCPDGPLGNNIHKFDAFLRDFAANTTEVISVPAPTLPSDTPLNPSGLTPSSVSSNGQYVAFTSESDGIVSGDTNGCQDVFVHDFSTGSNTLVSVSVFGPWAGNGNTSEPAISADGRYVAFSSYATNLVTNDFNNVYGYSDIFLRDLQAGSTVLISKSIGGDGDGDGSSFTPQLSADGRRLLFVSLADNLTTNASVTGSNLFWRDIQAGVTCAITTTGGVTVAAMTPDGSNVLFAIGAQLSLWNAGSRSVSSVATANSAVVDAAISADAHRAAFEAGGGCYAADLFARTNWLLADYIAATSRAHGQFTGDSRFLAYLAWDYTVGNYLHMTNQAYLYDFQNASNILVSQSYNSSAAGNGYSDSPVISADGRWIAWRSAATNLVPNDANGVPGIFLFDRLTNRTALVSVSMLGDYAANGRSLSPVFSGDDQALIFQSWASDLAPDDFNDSSDVFAFSLSSNESTNLAGVTISNGVTSIGDYAFAGCGSLTNVTIPGTVTNIGDHAFYGCASLSSVTISNGLAGIGQNAFEFCASLSSMVIPNGITNIGAEAFYGCRSLTNVTIPGGVISIGQDAFEFCSSLAGITIPGSVTSIGDGAFYDCGNLAGITIPNGVTNIGNDVFYGCASLTNITIPNGVTSIGNGAFQGCSSLAGITIPGSVTSIGDDAFQNCPNLAGVFFQGNAPAANSTVFANDNSATVYYLPGATGWSSTFDGLQAVELAAIAITANPTSGGASLTVNFTSASVDSLSHPVSNWNWYFSDGSTSAARNPSHTFTNAGAFTAALVETNNNGIPIAGGETSITVAAYLGLVLNGGFETGDFTGWTLSGDTNETFVDDGSQSDITPYSGNYGAALGTSDSLGHLSQTLSTAAGAGYLLSFWFNNPDADPGEFLVSWNGNTLLDTTNITDAADWTNMQFNVFATGTNTVLQFGFNDDDDYLGLDAVSVSVVSLPPLQLSSAAFSTNGGFQLVVNAQIGQPYTLQASTNLTDWISLLTFTCANSPVYVVDPTAANFSRRFYRLVQGTFLAPVTLGFGSAQPWTSNGLCMMLQGTMGPNYVIQASSDLLHWQPVTTVACTNSPVYFTDPAATNCNQRFYRSLVQ